jgi:hypothetical protein
MATVRVTEIHRVAFPGRKDADAFEAALPSLTNVRVDRGALVEVAATMLQRTPPAVRIEFAHATEVEGVDDCAWRVKQLAEAVAEARKQTTDNLRYGTRDGVSAVLGRALADSEPEVRVYVPLAEEDASALTGDDDAQKAVERAIHARTTVLEDQAEQLTGLHVTREPQHLTIASTASLSAAVAIAKAYITAPRTPPSASILPRSAPVWAWASAAVVLVTFALSWTPLTTATVCTLAGLVVAVAALATWVAPRFRAKRSTTAWGLAPAVVLVGFACFYAALIVAGSDRIAFDGEPPEYMHDALLLSLSLLTTGGLLDLHVEGWVRSIAYLEMLLVATLAGGAAIVAVRSASRRVDQLVSEVREQREGPRG